MIIEELFILVIPYISGSLEAIGVLIITLSGVRALYRLFKNSFNFKDDGISMDFARAMALSLEFKLGAEIIKTVIVKTLDEFIVLAAVAALRVILTLVIHWELKGK